jgi:hypothetical protein
MLIGISGKIGSGKDTVGKIIQHLTSEWADEKFQDTDMLNVRSDWKIKKLAGKLKQIASLLTGIDLERFEDQEFKKLNMNPEWGMTYREFLQKIGTDAMRDGLHENVWCNALFSDYKEIFISKGVGGFHDVRIPTVKSIGYPNWIITDVRFPNELKAVEDRGGITIRIERYSSNELGNLHPSETALDDATFDYVIYNTGTIEDLIEKVREILIDEKIL